MENKIIVHDDSVLGSRNKRGDWKPFTKPPLYPLYLFPFQPQKFFKNIFVWNGLFLNFYNILWASIAVFCWFFLTPSIETLKTFKIDWIAFIFFRNSIIVLVYVSFFHYHFYVKKSQGNSFKYNRQFLQTNNSKFCFKDQTKDNLIYVFLSAIPIWSAYEVITLWLYANQLIPWVNWDTYPIYLSIMFLLIPTFRSLHFYLTHRLLHWGPLYRVAHKVHHKNSNPGPWSGLSMHPIEHFLYYTCVMIHWIIPSHPTIAMWNLFHAGLSPHAGHAGYDRIVFKNGKWIPTGSFFHYLHHKYFECNYAGDDLSFLDKMFGTFHDGTDEGTEAVMKRLKKKNYIKIFKI
jgi:sterol desaturase/sphingolipid hydroxylase (fatty acid hydroxylase superfamily)